MTRKIVHLHWLWRHPGRIGKPHNAIAACGADKLQPNEWERFVEDGVTCEACLQRATAMQPSSEEELREHAPRYFYKH